MSKRFNGSAAALPVSILAAVLCGFILLGGTMLRTSPALAAPPAAQSDGPAAPAAACPPDGQCFADVSPSNPFYAYANDIYADDVVSGYSCNVYPAGPCDTYARPYFLPANFVTRGQMAKFVDLARNNAGIYIDTPSEGLPLLSRTTVGDGTGLYGIAPAGDGVRGDSSNGDHSGVVGVNSGGGAGVTGRSNGVGVHGETTGNDDGVVGMSGATDRSGVYGMNTGNGYGVYGLSQGDGQGVFGASMGQDGVQGRSYSQQDSGVYGLNMNGGFGIAGRSNGTGEKAAVFGQNVGSGYAGYFVGNVIATGTCCAAAASTIRIDDPLDPANKYLSHAAVASSEMLDVYNGNVTTDANGAATVELPAYFEALNGDFRYQLTPIGQFAQVIVSSKINDNRFTIRSDKPNVEVSWLVTGVRNDPYAKANPLLVEQDKAANERGYYLHPELYGQPANMRVEESLRH